MKLRLSPVKVSSHIAALEFDDDGGEVLVRRAGEDAEALANRIATAVNCHGALVAALMPFGSSQMGNMLIDQITWGLAEDHSALQVAEAAGRLRALIDAVDLVLKAVEIKERGDDVPAGETDDGVA